MRSTMRPSRVLSTEMIVPTAVNMNTGATTSWITRATSGMCGSITVRVLCADATGGRVPFSAASRFQNLPERDGVVVIPVRGAVDERHRAFTRELDEPRHRLGLRRELASVTSAELVPLRGIVTEPLAQRRARRQFLEPEIDVRGILRHAARPQPVHQH